MTCFWDGILNCLEKKDFYDLGIDFKPTPTYFIKLLKKNNKICSSVKWNNEYLSEQFLNECVESINNLDINKINNGYFCSTCDPFLILICKLFKVNIFHKYLNNIMKYEEKNNLKAIHVKSNKTHFQKI